MDLLYLSLIFAIPIAVILLYNLYEEFEEEITQFVKGIFSCLGQILFVLICIILLGLACNWLFKDCTPVDPDAAGYDYDPGLTRRY